VPLDGFATRILWSGASPLPGDPDVHRLLHTRFNSIFARESVNLKTGLTCAAVDPRIEQNRGKARMPEGFEAIFGIFPVFPRGDMSVTKKFLLEFAFELLQLNDFAKTIWIEWMLW
jgi:hypothetical protein